MTNQKILSMSFAKVYPLYIAKAEKKKRTKNEVDEIIRWLFGYGRQELEAHLAKETDFRAFIEECPRLNPNRKLITGMVCGVRVEEIEDPLMREIRYLDKLIDELARGKAMSKILRAEEANPVEAYIRQQPPEVRPFLEQVREIIKRAAPDAAEGFSYGMPAYKLKGKPLVYFAAKKKHLGFYATPSGHDRFSQELSRYKQGKGSVQFPYDKPIPYDLIEEMVRFRRDEETKSNLIGKED